MINSSACDSWSLSGLPSDLWPLLFSRRSRWGPTQCRSRSESLTRPLRSLKMLLKTLLLRVSSQKHTKELRITLQWLTPSTAIPSLIVRGEVKPKMKNSVCIVSPQWSFVVHKTFLELHSVAAFSQTTEGARDLFWIEKNNQKSTNKIDMYNLSDIIQVSRKPAGQAAWSRFMSPAISVAKLSSLS